MSHDRARSLISAGMDEVLPAADQRALQEHLVGCASCRQFAVRTESLARDLRDLPYLPPSPSVSRAVWQGIQGGRSPWAWLGGLRFASGPALAVVSSLVLIAALAFTVSLALNPPGTKENAPRATIDAVALAPSAPTPTVLAVAPAAPTAPPTAETAQAVYPTAPPAPTARPATRATQPVSVQARATNTPVPPEPTAIPIAAPAPPVATTEPAIVIATNPPATEAPPPTEAPQVAMAEQPQTIESAQPADTARQSAAAEAPAAAGGSTTAIDGSIAPAASGDTVADVPTESAPLDTATALMAPETPAEPAVEPTSTPPAIVAAAVEQPTIAPVEGSDLESSPSVASEEPTSPSIEPVDGPPSIDAPQPDGGPPNGYEGETTAGDATTGTALEPTPFPFGDGAAGPGETPAADASAGATATATATVQPPAVVKPTKTPIVISVAGSAGEGASIQVGDVQAGATTVPDKP